MSIRKKYQGLYHGFNPQGMDSMTILVIWTMVGVIVSFMQLF